MTAGSAAADAAPDENVGRGQMPPDLVALEQPARDGRVARGQRTRATERP